MDSNSGWTRRGAAAVCLSQGFMAQSVTESAIFRSDKLRDSASDACMVQRCTTTMPPPASASSSLTLLALAIISAIRLSKLTASAARLPSSPSSSSYCFHLSIILIPFGSQAGSRTRRAPLPPLLSQGRGRIVARSLSRSISFFLPPIPPSIRRLRASRGANVISDQMVNLLFQQRN